MVLYAMTSRGDDNGWIRILRSALPGQGTSVSRVFRSSGTSCACTRERILPFRGRYVLHQVLRVVLRGTLNDRCSGLQCLHTLPLAIAPCAEEYILPVSGGEATKKWDLA